MPTLSLILLSQITAAVVNYLADLLPIGWNLDGPQNRSARAKVSQIFFGGPRVLFVQGGFLLAFWWLNRFEFVGWETWELWALFSYLVLVSVIDIEQRLILHPVSLAGALLLGSIGAAKHGLGDTLLGGIAGFAAVFALYWTAQFFVQWMRSRRTEEIDEVPFGFGDVTLSGLIGLLLGWPGVIAGLFLGITLAGIYSAVLIGWRWVRGRYEAFATIPLGPFLATGALLAILLAART